MEPSSRPTRNDVVKLLVRKREPVVFDIGANEGQSTSDFLSVFPQAQVHAFEPSGETFQRLSSVHGADPRVTLNHAGVGDGSGRQTFHVYDNSQTSSFLPQDPAGPYAAREIGFQRSEDVSVVSLDDYMRDAGVDRCDLCKIDTQGYSGSVLRGAAKALADQRIDVLQIEILLAPYYERTDSFLEIESLLAPSGYVLYTILETDTHLVGGSYIDYRTGRLLHLDALYARAEVAASISPIASR